MSNSGIESRERASRMMSTKAQGGVAVAMMAVCLGLPSIAQAVSPARLSGTISGQVTDSTGVPQMGATVFLFNKYDRLYEKVLTDERGLFLFSGLLPDIYSIRVTLASFVPAIKSNILVQPGVQSMLNVSLANLFSSIQLIYPTPENRALMSEDWKWVLRTASETRPVLRLLPGSSRNTQHAASVFSDTRGVLRLSSGEGEPSPGYSADADLGTAFALATSLYGNNVLAVSGKFGYGSQSGIPSAAFRTSFSRDTGGGSPEVALTMRQMFLSGRLGNAVSGLDGSLPAMRSMTLDFDDRTQLADNLSLRYGFSLDSLSFLDRLNYFSPYARLSYDMGGNGTVEVTYTSGNARPSLGGARSAGELQRDLNTLTLFPRVSLRNWRARVQRGEDYEISYSRKFGSRALRLSGYRESVSNAALTVDAPEGVYTSGDILPDVYSGTAIFNAGNYESLGYTASLTQTLGEQFSATLMFGSAGALTADRGELVSDNPDDLRAMIHAGRRHAATLRTDATLPWSGTHLIGSYQWADSRRMVTPGHLYSTQSMRPEPGLNLYIRQPIPWSPFPWRMEITADLRNLLAQGYLPLTMSGTRRVLLMQTPRAFRGGVSFIF